MFKRSALLLLLTVVGLLVSPAAYASGYDWPVKPFNKQHPIRGTFDDPRISTRHIDTPGNGSLSFHFGVDVAAPDGTPVYSVSAGTANVHSDRVGIVARYRRDPRGRLVYGYWHIRPVIRQNQFVQKHQLIGHVLPGMGHVHFAERQRGQYVNPLRRGGLTPYRDYSPPTIKSADAYQGGEYKTLGHGLTLGGKLDLVVDAFDTPPMRTPWATVVLTPSVITWKLVDEYGSVVVPTRKAVDFTRFYYRRLTSIYAPGTLQNGPNQRGVYNFWLARRFDTTELPNGTFYLRIKASDVRGNRSQRTFGFVVAN